MNLDHREIIRLLGGAPSVAVKLGREKSTVGSWRDRNSIPARHWPEIVAVSAGAVTMDDMITGAPPRKPYTRKIAAKCGSAQVEPSPTRVAA